MGIQIEERYIDREICRDGVRERERGHTERKKRKADISKSASHYHLHACGVSPYRNYELHKVIWERKAQSGCIVALLVFARVSGFFYQDLNNINPSP